MKVGMALKRTKAKLRQLNQQEGAKNAKLPQFKHIESDDWAGSGKSSLAPFRLSRDSKVEPGAGYTFRRITRTFDNFVVLCPPFSWG